MKPGLWYFAREYFYIFSNSSPISKTQIHLVVEISRAAAPHFWPTRATDLLLRTLCTAPSPDLSWQLVLAPFNWSTSVFWLFHQYQEKLSYSNFEFHSSLLQGCHVGAGSLPSGFFGVYWMVGLALLCIKAANQTFEWHPFGWNWLSWTCFAAAPWFGPPKLRIFYYGPFTLLLAQIWAANWFWHLSIGLSQYSDWSIKTKRSYPIQVLNFTPVCCRAAMWAQDLYLLASLVCTGWLGLLYYA